MDRSSSAATFEAMPETTAPAPSKTPTADNLRLSGVADKGAVMLEWLIGDVEAEKQARSFYGDEVYTAIRNHERKLWAWQQIRAKTAQDRIDDVAQQIKPPR